MKIRNEEILCAGHGGQGIMLMGKLLALTAMNIGYEVTWIPSYGAEVRGGTAHAMIRIRDKEKIANPVVTHPGICVVMNRPSLAKFICRVKPGGLFVADSSNIPEIPSAKGVTVRSAPFEKIALGLGDKRAANMVALGMMNGLKGLFPLERLKEGIKYVFAGKESLLAVNMKAIDEGDALGKAEVTRIG